MGDTGEKTEEATPEKLRKSQEEGQVPKSQDFVSAVGFAGGFATLAALFAYTADQLKDWTLAAIDAAFRRPSLDTVSLMLRDALPFMLKLTLPVCATVFVLGIFSNVIQTGFFIAFKAIIPKIDKINPVNGFKGMFKMKKLIELLKNLAKMAVVTWLAYDIVKTSLNDMVLLVSFPLFDSVDYAAYLLGDFMKKVIAIFLAIGLADILLARKQFSKEMMMSKYDVKQEYKQSEGDPHMKGQRKQLAQELLFSGSQENVKNADAVVVNPAHIAVAIRYDKDKNKAPTVVAKGMRMHAEKIKEIAKHYGVPILRNVPLAQALNRLDIGEEIPEELFEAVAEVLAFVYKIREEQEQKTKRKREPPKDPRLGPKKPDLDPGKQGPVPSGATGLRGADRLRGDKPK